MCRHCGDIFDDADEKVNYCYDCEHQCECCQLLLSSVKRECTLIDEYGKNAVVLLIKQNGDYVYHQYHYQLLKFIKGHYPQYAYLIDIVKLLK